MFPTGNFGIFLFFPQFVTHFFAQIQRDATFLTLKKNHLTQGVKVPIQYLTHGKVMSTFIFFMWYDVKDFLLSFYSHGCYVVKEVIHLIE